MSSIESFREQVTTWLADNCADDLRGRQRDRLSRKRYDEWVRLLGSQGWAAPGWPREYGGGGLDRAEQAVLAEEMRAVRAPQPFSFGFMMLGPTLLELATEEQKHEHLTKIARHEVIWCQGYSEPGAGSDLASLQTKAVRDGDEYVITGQKIWTSGAHHADWMFCLARTDPDAPKHEGISFFLLPMDQETIRVSPIRLLDGSEVFAQVFLDGARAKSSDVIGPINGGWTVAKRLLQHERGASTPEGRAHKSNGSSSLADLAVEYVGVTNGHLRDSVLRDRIVQYELDSSAFGLTMRRAAEEMRSGQMERELVSMSKYYWSELTKREQELAMHALGSRGLGWKGEDCEKDELARTRAWLRAPANSIWGGTSEIQRNVIAKRVLGIPE